MPNRTRFSGYVYQHLPAEEGRHLNQPRASRVCNLCSIDPRVTGCHHTDTILSNYGQPCWLPVTSKFLPSLCYGCKIWSVLRVQVSYCRSGKGANWFPENPAGSPDPHQHPACPCRVWQVSSEDWQAPAAKYLSCLESMEDKQAFVADRRSRSPSTHHKASNLRHSSMLYPWTLPLQTATAIAASQYNQHNQLT